MILMSALVQQRKSSVLILVSKAKAKFCLSVHYNGDNSYLLVNRKEIFKFKAYKKMSTFQLNFT